MKLENDYGVFSSYTPDPAKMPPGYENAPRQIGFWKNEKGADFYTSVYALGTPATGHLFMFVDAGNIVRSVVIDSDGTPPGRTLLGQPLNLRVLEFSDPVANKDYMGSKWKGGIVFEDPASLARPFVYKLDFWRRCTTDEAAQFTADLADADPQLQAIFNAATEIHYDAPEYALLLAAVNQRVTPARSAELLAPSDPV